MDHVERESLRYIYLADHHRRDSGHEAERFHLMYPGGDRVINHPGWDHSWPAPHEITIDTLTELGHLRQDPVVGGNKERSFVLTPGGQQEGKILHEQRGQPIHVGGWAPPLPSVLSWLLSLDEKSPDAFKPASALLERAVEDALIVPTGRTVLAERILVLVDEGYLDGQVIDSDQATAEQVLAYTPSLHLTMKAYDAARPDRLSMTIMGDVTNSVIAGRDVSLAVFVEALDRVAAEIEARDDVPDATKKGARDLISQIRDWAMGASGEVAVATSGGLAAEGILQALRMLHTG